MPVSVHPPISAALTEDLYFETLKSERKRTIILLAVFCVAVAGWSVLYFQFRDVVNRAFGISFPFTTVLTLVSLMAVYESVVLFALSRAIRLRRPLPRVFQYGNAFAETSVPTVALALLANAMDPHLAFSSPVPYLYFVFIVLSVLRLRFSLSIFTGIISAVQYYSISRYFLSGDSIVSLDHYLQSSVLAIGRSVVMLIGGVAAGFVAGELRRRMETSLIVSEERNRVRSMFGQYVSPSVVNKLLEQTTLVAEIRHVCIMFLDIRNFTAFAESRKPEEVIIFLNILFGRFIEIVGRHNGIINKFLGDGFMAVFGAPLSDGRDVRNAVYAANEIIAAVEDLNRRKEIPKTAIGIGLHAGSAVTGNVGSEERKEYTIIGDTVNLASRVEQLNKKFGSTLLVTEAVHDVVRNEFRGKVLRSTAVKGRRERVKVVRLK